MLLLKNSIKFSTFVAKMAENLKLSAQRAQRVKTNYLTDSMSAQHEAKLKQKVTLESEVEGLQKELNQQIGLSLKRSETKLNDLRKKAFELYALSQKNALNDREKEAYNRLIDEALHARWQFLVHRQCIGFQTRNYELVHSMYDIPGKMI